MNLGRWLANRGFQRERRAVLELLRLDVGCDLDLFDGRLRLRSLDDGTYAVASSGEIARPDVLFEVFSSPAVYWSAGAPEQVFETAEDATDFFCAARRALLMGFDYEWAPLELDGVSTEVLDAIRERRELFVQLDWLSVDSAPALGPSQVLGAIIDTYGGLIVQIEEPLDELRTPVPGHPGLPGAGLVDDRTDVDALVGELVTQHWVGISNDADPSRLADVEGLVPPGATRPEVVALADDVGATVVVVPYYDGAHWLVYVSQAT